MAKLYFRYSAMNAGKSTALLQVAHNYERDLGVGVLIFTAALDDRFGTGKVTSRLGIAHKALTFDAKTNFNERIQEETIFYATGRMQNDQPTLAFRLRGTKKEVELKCILIDEAQFLSPKQVRWLHEFAHASDVPVICYGIRTDFSGKGFPGSAALLALADAIEEIKTVCSRCKNRKATMNPRVDDEGRRIMQGPQVGIEGKAYRYAPMCPRCFYETGSKART